MDHRGWPWKKKSSEKTITEKNVDAASDSAEASLASMSSPQEQENRKNVNYVQVSLDSYIHLTNLEGEVKAWEDQVKLLQDEIKDLNEKLSAAHLEITAKDNFLKEQAKVAEEAVSGWEKADAEAVALKHQVESVTLMKLTAENRVSHLEGALKECVREIRIVKEENEQKLHELVLTKTKQWENIKLDLEEQINELDQRLLTSAAENAALSRSLQEHSNMVMELTRQKSGLHVEKELLKGNIQSCEREMSSLKYELHVASKEVDIRNEEKNMSMKSAEAANKQNLEGVRKVAKLEAECQRLCNRVRKKLPGSAALAQMKQESAILSHNSVEPQPRRLQVKTSKSLSSSHPEFSFDSLQPPNTETEFLTTRLLAAEEETKMLKEALATRNSELQSSREICAKMVGRLKTLEGQQGILNQERSSPRSIFEIHTEGSFSRNANNPHSVASISEDGFDGDRSSAESWVTSTISDIYHLQKDKNSAVSFNLMDDFLEMERLAGSADDSDKVTANSSCSNFMRPEVVIESEDFLQSKRQSSMILSANQISMDVEDLIKCLEPERTKNVITFTQGSKLTKASIHSDNFKLMDVISHVHQFVLSLVDEVVKVHENSTVRHGLTKKLEDFSSSLRNILTNKISVVEFVHDLSCGLNQAYEARFSFDKVQEGVIIDSDCIDKVALTENEVVTEKLCGQNFSDKRGHITYSTCDQDGNACPGLVPSIGSSEEWEQAKLNNDSMALELAGCTQDLEITKLKLLKTEQLLVELRSELAASQRLYSLAETQLKCMAESYKSVEMRAQELEAKVNLLQMKKENQLSIVIHEKKWSHWDSQARSDDIDDQTKRDESCSMCSFSPTMDFEIKAKQERELAAATAKLAECQETIYLLGKQLKALCPQTDSTSSNSEEKKPGHDVQNLQAISLFS